MSMSLAQEIAVAARDNDAEPIGVFVDGSAVLLRIWVAMEVVCGKRMAPLLRLLIHLIMR